MKQHEATQILPDEAVNSRAILTSRMRALARPLEVSPAAGEMLQLVEFRLANERYAVEQQYVLEVHTLHMLTLLPCAPAFIAGVINFRGQILPVIDIKKFFDLPNTGITDLHVVVVVRDGDMELGILADAVAGMRSVATSLVQPSLPTLAGIRAMYLKGVTNEHMVILDVSKIMADPKILVNDKSGTAEIE